MKTIKDIQDEKKRHIERRIKQIKLFVTVFVFLLTINFINAEVQTLGTFKQNSNVILIQSCTNSTYSNVSRVTYPNSTIAISTQNLMTKNNDDYFYNFNLTDSLGEYLVYGSCDEKGVLTSWQYNFYITRSGFQLTTQESMIYMILFFSILLIFGVCFYFMIVIPYGNVKNEFNETILLTKSKYIKLVLVGVCYGLFVWILNLLIGLSNNFVSLTIYYGFINMLFNMFIRMSYIFFIILIIIFVITMIKDMNFKKKMNELWGIKI